jgi:ribosomal-protein-alanine N-acetyltransferase
VKRDSLEHPDLGFAFLQRFWSRGYAREAAGATVALARDALLLPYLYGVVSPGNPRSIHLLESLGLRYVRSMQQAGQPSESRVYGVDLRAA